ncbi:class III extradiol ring-cleavage dioxygenase [Thalassospira sp. MCCC 1A01428]|uniref:DODA-type extradiol aromatic ring-opening family dioxygenase n=1 Tax=Thalassospira sp. MCCC 1A01428 TaxID=1470575 RepID=UPI000A1DE558|nr:class III extradiol ring-cleavage dioxygenase [Thalassospira sp. MCCC 1A01428]
MPHSSNIPQTNALAPIFISHGSPMLVARQSTPAFNFLHTELPDHLDGAQAILIVSAHWQAPVATISTAQHQETIHDFYGFPDALYQLHYDVAGAPDLASTIAHKIGAKTDDQRGLDHGAWMPMILARPQADIPVFQLSMIENGSPADHFALGKKLRGLREMGVLVIGSGAMTHNLRALDRNDGPNADAWAEEFCQWMVENTKQHDIDTLLAYRSKAPHARMAHPHDDHLMPFYVALGAADDHYICKTLHHSIEFGNLAMTALRFYDQETSIKAA